MVLLEIDILHSMNYLELGFSAKSKSSLMCSHGAGCVKHKTKIR